MKQRMTAIALVLCALAGLLAAPASAKGITNKELRAIFNENRELLQDITTQYISLSEEYFETGVDERDKNLGMSIQQNYERYYEVFDAANFPEISSCQGMSEGSVCVQFSFQLAPGISRGLSYSTDPFAEERLRQVGARSERLADHWVLYNENRPWIWFLYYVCFGWIWMR